MKYRIYFVNFEYFSQREFDTLDEAIHFAKVSTFESTIWYNNQRVASFSMFGGVRRYKHEKVT